MLITLPDVLRVARGQVATYRWHKVFNEKPAGQQRGNPLRIQSACAHRILTDLRKHGIAMFHLSELPGGASLLSELTEDYERTLADQAGEIVRRREMLRLGALPGEDAVYKTSLITWYPTGSPPPSAHALGRWALYPEMLAIVNEYMGMYGQILALKYWYSVASGGQKADGSQVWHRDYNDWHLVKTFLYVDDVDEETGPFAFVKGTHRGVLRHTDPPFFRDSLGARRVSDEQMETFAPKSKWITAVGKAGTVIVADTTGFHKGGFATRHDRKMIVVAYKSPWCRERVEGPIVGVPVDAHPAVRVAAYAEGAAAPSSSPDRSTRRADV